jgi:DNA invertase Pin-like site-specific DNA recombinase
MKRNRRQTGDAARVVGYLRVSTDEQHLGPEAQRDALARWCSAHGAELVAVHQDLGVSGGAELEKRPGLLAALADLAAHGAGVLLVAKRDRLARDVMVAAMVERLAERSGARVLSADGIGDAQTPEGMLLRGMVDLFAQYERALIRSRTRAALAVKRSRGERIGKVPLGYSVDADGCHLVENPTEQQALALIRDLRAEGLSLRAVTARLNESVTPSRGSRWHLRTVHRLCSRAA